MKDKFSSIKDLLEKESVPYETIVRVMSGIEGLRSECNELRRRLTWLEEKIDEKDIEDLFVEYQKRFKLNYWSGDPS